MNPSIDISIEFSAWRDLPGILKIAKRSVAATLKITAYKILPESELSVVLSDDAKIRDLNRAWRGIDKATNVLSFSLAPQVRGPLLGDIVISYQTLDRESRVAKIPLENHFAHMIVHGFLHLLGFDHEDDSDAESMESCERKALAILGIKDPYPTSPKSKV